MRAPPPGPAACAALLLIFHATLVLSSEDGYEPEEGYSEEPIDLDMEDLSTVCPTSRVLRSRETCPVDGVAVPCIKLLCCEGYIHIGGRCVPSEVDPCSLNLCEQACEVRGEKLWCSCYRGFRFSKENYAMKTQPYCVDENECAINNGGCEQHCINDPGGFHCECTPPLRLVAEGKCIPIPEPLPLMRASSRCYAPCDTVSWLSKKVRQLSEQLRSTQASLSKLMENPILTGDDDRLPEGTHAYRVLDSTAILEDGYCRCERGPRGPAGPPGMEGPKGDTGPRGPRGHRGPKASLDMVLLLLADVKHDVQNLEAKVYKKGEYPDRFNLEKAWRENQKEEREPKEGNTENEDMSPLEAFTLSPELTETTIEISPHGRTGEISHETETTTDWPTGKTEGYKSAIILPDELNEQLKEFWMLAKMPTDDDDDTDNDY